MVSKYSGCKVCTISSFGASGDTYLFGPLTSEAPFTRAVWPWADPSPSCSFAFPSSEENVLPWTSVMTVLCVTPQPCSTCKGWKRRALRGEKPQGIHDHVPRLPRLGFFPSPLPTVDLGRCCLRIPTSGQRDGPWAMLGWCPGDILW